MCQGLGPKKHDEISEINGEESIEIISAGLPHQETRLEWSPLLSLEYSMYYIYAS